VGEEINWIHRREGDTELYFIANRRNESVTRYLKFRVTGKVAELWDPMTGKIHPLSHVKTEGPHTIIPIRFDPLQSWFVVFKDQPSKNLAKDAPHAETSLIQEIAGEWDLSFDPAWGTDKTLKLDKLTSWTEHADDLVKYYSGIGIYRTTFEFTKAAAGRRILLDLGTVKNVAQVTLNGKDCGIAWKPPYQVDITDATQVGHNELVIQVANTWVNRLVGDEQLPVDVEAKWEGGRRFLEWPAWFKEGRKNPTGRYTFTTYRHYKKDSPILPSGLLGPVRVLSSTPGTRHD
jgi:hypothetical protein